MEQNSELHYIEVDEHTTKKDVEHAFSMIGAAQARRTVNTKPDKDPLAAIRCALLYDRHNTVDPSDKRCWKWTYERLAKEFGLKSKRAAKSYVGLGREYLKGD